MGPPAHLACGPCKVLGEGSIKQIVRSGTTIPQRPSIGATHTYTQPHALQTLPRRIGEVESGGSSDHGSDLRSQISQGGHSVLGGPRTASGILLAL
jgi:hypothetical protein